MSRDGALMRCRAIHDPAAMKNSTLRAAASICTLALTASAQNWLQELPPTSVPQVQPSGMSADTTVVVGYGASGNYRLNVQAAAWGPLGAASALPRCSSDGSYVCSDILPATGLSTA